jgi:aspartate kinase
MIPTSETKAAVAIDEKYAVLAMRSLHKAFELGQEAA